MARKKSKARQKFHPCGRCGKQVDTGPPYAFFLGNDGTVYHEKCGRKDMREKGIGGSEKWD